MRLLIVEDDQALRDQLTRHFQRSGYVVDAACDGKEGLYFAREYQFDAAVIDLGLPELSGINLISQIRSEQLKLPILVLTARSHWRDKVEGLEVGADDYLTKPFQLEELLARLNALIRRAGGHATPHIELGPLVVDTFAQRAYLDQQPLELTAFEYKLLAYMVVNLQRVISKTELTEHLYAQDYDRDSNVIEVLIGRLRRKLSPYPLIKTARGQGYRMQADDATQ